MVNFGKLLLQVNAAVMLHHSIILQKWFIKITLLKLLFHFFFTFLGVKFSLIHIYGLYLLLIQFFQ